MTDSENPTPNREADKGRIYANYDSFCDVVIPLSLGNSEKAPKRSIYAIEMGGVAITASGEENDSLHGMLDDSDDQREKATAASKWVDSQTGSASDVSVQIPEVIAVDIAIEAQKRLIVDADDVLDDDYYRMVRIRDRAIEAAGELDFKLIEMNEGSWSLQARFNEMHDKFKHVDPEDLSRFLGNNDKYEYKALFIKDIIADHAPELLTGDLKILVDPAQPHWRKSIAQAEIIFKNRNKLNIGGMQVASIRTPPVLDNLEGYVSEDGGSTRSVKTMTDEEIRFYSRADVVPEVKQRGYLLFDELNESARQALLAQKLFEAVGESNNQASKQRADERNRMLENEPLLRQGNLVHATRTAEILNAILTDGLRCGEAIIGNQRSVIAHPFTVSFLEVSQELSERETISERLDGVKNSAYGPINIVFDKEVSTKEYKRSADRGLTHQGQVFGGVASTEITSIILREDETTGLLVDNVIQAVVKNGMFIPVYEGNTGKPLLTSQQFDQLTVL